MTGREPNVIALKHKMNLDRPHRSNAHSSIAVATQPFCSLPRFYEFTAINTVNTSKVSYHTGVPALLFRNILHHGKSKGT